jgi:hypothetical protein
MNKADIIALFKSFGCTITQDDIWAVQSATVIKHKALERLAASAKITFSAPQVLRSEKDEAVLLVFGSLADRKEWSIGEALVNVNYRVSGKQAAYVYAMAEKRAKDRVILKLAGLHGLYSEDEADEFKEQPQAAPKPAPPAAQPAEVERLITMIDKATSAVELGKWMSNPRVTNVMDVMSLDDLERITAAQTAKLMLFERDAA